MKSNRQQTPAQRMVRTGAAAGVAAGLVVLSVAQAGTAIAAKKAEDQTASGTIKIHNVGTGEDDNRNEPKVCAFTLVGDTFDDGETLNYEFILGAPFKDAPSLTGSLVADSLGSWSTNTINLAPGHWKVFVDDGEDIKHKVFKVDCDPGDDDPGDDDPPGDTPPGDTPPGDTPPGDTPPGDTPPGDTPPGDTPPGTEGNPIPEVVPVVLPPAEVPGTVIEEGSPIEEAGTGNDTVTGTREPADSTTPLPKTGANTAGVGAAGLLLMGVGLGLRRWGRGTAD